MQIKFQIDGGLAYFPGLSGPVTIDSDKIPAEEASELEHLVKEARFFDLPKQVGVRPGRGADYQQYTITIKDGKRIHTIQFVDPIQDPALQALVKYLKSKISRKDREASSSE